MNTFKDYQAELYRAFNRQKLDVKLLATDAASGWSSVDWASKKMDDITGVYGGHTYTEHALDDPSFYPWWLAHMQDGTAIGRSKGKPFILGEFGTGQGEKDGADLPVKCCKFNETPQESMVGIQLSEAAIGAMNAGIYATAYWTFMDAPEYPFFDAKSRTGWPYQLHGALTPCGRRGGERGLRDRTENLREAACCGDRAGCQGMNPATTRKPTSWTRCHWGKGSRKLAVAREGASVKEPPRTTRSVNRLGAPSGSRPVS